MLINNADLSPLANQLPEFLDYSGLRMLRPAIRQGIKASLYFGVANETLTRFLSYSVSSNTSSSHNLGSIYEIYDNDVYHLKLMLEIQLPRVYRKN